MKVILYILAVLFLAAGLTVPTRVKTEGKRTTQCQMCKAIRVEEHREVKSILPLFNKDIDEITGGKGDCKHWWRSESQGYGGMGINLGSIVKPLRIALFLLTPLMIVIAVRKEKKEGV